MQIFHEKEMIMQPLLINTSSKKSKYLRNHKILWPQKCNGTFFLRLTHCDRNLNFLPSLACECKRSDAEKTFPKVRKMGWAFEGEKKTGKRGAKNFLKMSDGDRAKVAEKHASQVGFFQ